EELLCSLERKRDARAWKDLHKKGYELATASVPRAASEVDREDVRLRARSGRNPLGQNLLLARRLVEAGVGFVTVNGWTGPAPGVAGSGPAGSRWGPARGAAATVPAEFELGHARRRDGHGQRLRQRVVRHGLVPAGVRRGDVGAA